MAVNPAVMAAAPPRVFVVRGDLLQLACDHVVIPTDVHRVVESYWRDHLGRVGVEVVEGVARVAAGDGGAADAVQGEPVRVYGPFMAGEGAAVASMATWLVAAADATVDATGPAEEGDLVGLDVALGQFRARYLDAVADADGPPVAGARGEPKASSEDFCWPPTGDFSERHHALKPKRQSHLETHARHRRPPAPSTQDRNPWLNVRFGGCIQGGSPVR